MSSQLCDLQQQLASLSQERESLQSRISTLSEQVTCGSEAAGRLGRELEEVRATAASSASRVEELGARLEQEERAHGETREKEAAVSREVSGGRVEAWLAGSCGIEIVHMWGVDIIGYLLYRLPEWLACSLNEHGHVVYMQLMAVKLELAKQQQAASQNSTMLQEQMAALQAEKLR